MHEEKHPFSLYLPRTRAGSQQPQATRAIANVAKQVTKTTP
jgi:hypothetical protein